MQQDMQMQQPQMPVGNQMQEQPQEPKKSKMSWLMIVIFALIFLGILAAVWFLI